MLQCKILVYQLLLALQLGPLLLHAAPAGELVWTTKTVTPESTPSAPKGLGPDFVGLPPRSSKNGAIHHYAITTPHDGRTITPLRTDKEAINLNRHHPETAKEINRNRHLELQWGGVNRWAPKWKKKFWIEQMNDAISTDAFNRINKKKIVRINHGGVTKLYHHPDMEGSEALKKDEAGQVHHMKLIEPEPNPEPETSVQGKSIREKWDLNRPYNRKGRTNTGRTSPGLRVQTAIMKYEKMKQAKRIAWGRQSKAKEGVRSAKRPLDLNETPRDEPVDTSSPVGPQEKDDRMKSAKKARLGVKGMESQVKGKGFKRSAAPRLASYDAVKRPRVAKGG
jgi:hypothetical protein